MKIQTKTDISGKWVAIQDHEEALKESYDLGYQAALDSLNINKDMADLIKVKQHKD